MGHANKCSYAILRGVRIAYLPFFQGPQSSTTHLHNLQRSFSTPYSPELTDPGLEVHFAR
jgi:hypothetical protein